MEAEKTESQNTHNLMLTTFLPSHQVKHLAFFRIDHPKHIIHMHSELKLVSGLAAATTNILTLYAVYENAVAFQLGNWRMHEDIVGIVGWDKLIVVYTAQRIVGFRYEGGFLRNSFMISLQFLPLEDRDQCKVYADRMGYYLLIRIRNYLIFCFSETLANKYKSRVCEKQKVEIIGEEVRWNDPLASRPFIIDMVKVKLTDLQLNSVEQIRLVDETIYLMGNRGKESTLYFMHTYFFFNNHIKVPSGNQSALASPVPHRDQPPANARVFICHPRPSSSATNPDFIYVQKTPRTVTLKSQQSTYQIGSFGKQIKVLSLPSTMFPILIWQPDEDKFSIVERYKTYQDSYQFKHYNIAEDLYAETAIYREGLIVTASRTDVVLLTNNGKRETLHQSLGSILEIHVGKDILFIQNSKHHQTRLWEISRGPKVDPRPFVTHKKKMFLQKMPDLKGLYSLPIGKNSEVLVVRSGNVFNFYKEGTEFEPILEAASEYLEMASKEENFLLLRSVDGKSGKIASWDGKTFNLADLSWEGWSMQRRWCLGDYLVGSQSQLWAFYNIFTQEKATFTLPIERTSNKFLNSFFVFRNTCLQRNSKDDQLVELYLSYSNLLEVWLLNLTKQEKRALYKVLNPAEGSPILSNELLQQSPDSHIKDRFRSITCPEYCLSEQSIRSTYDSQAEVIASHLYVEQNKMTLLLVTSEQQLLIYKKYFNLDECGFLLRRVCTPLNVVKNFSWNEDRPFKNLGQGLVRAGNFLLHKGQLLESISARSLFKMQGCLWVLLTDNRIRQVQLGPQVLDGFWLRQIDCAFKEQLIGIQSTAEYYCIYARKGFEIFSKQMQSHWKCQLGNETIVALKLFEHYVGMSYYDYYRDDEGVSDYESVRFRFRIYNCATKNKIVQREKALDQPILHIRFMPPDKLLLVTSSVIFINLFKNDKTQLEPFRAHNFTAKRSFITSFSHIPDIVPSYPGAHGSPTYMLFGGSHGGLGFYVGKWIQEQKLKEQWFEGLRCPIRHTCFFHFGEVEEAELKALVVDDESNLMVLTLKKDRAEKIGDIRLGAQVNAIKSKSGQGFVVFCALNDGSIRLLTTVKLQSTEVGFLDFQNVFCREMPFVGGFNLRWSRQLQQQYRSARLVSKGNIVDGDLLSQFFSLTNALQDYIAEQSQMQVNALKAGLPF